MAYRYFVSTAFASLTLALVSGCGASGPQTYPVTGTVTFDGQPVAEGDVIFKSADGLTAGSAGKIADGKFEFKSLPGSKMVSIQAMRDIPGKFDESNPGEKVQMRESYIPKAYNEETTLTADVSDSSTVFNFDLKSKP